MKLINRLITVLAVNDINDIDSIDDGDNKSNDQLSDDGDDDDTGYYSDDVLSLTVKVSVIVITVMMMSANANCHNANSIPAYLSLEAALIMGSQPLHGVVNVIDRRQTAANHLGAQSVSAVCSSIHIC